jgi:hypothetical protein
MNAARISDCGSTAGVCGEAALVHKPKNNRNEITMQFDMETQDRAQ